MTDSKLFWFFMGGISSLSLLVVWSSFNGAGKKLKKKMEDPSYRQIRELIDEANEMLDLLKHNEHNDSL